MKNVNSQVERLPLSSAQAMTQDVNVLEILEKAKLMRAQVIAKAISDIRSAIKAHFVAKRNERMLADLSDEILSDIGIERAQIPEIAKGLINGNFHPASNEAFVLAVFKPANRSVQSVHRDDLPLAA